MSNAGYPLDAYVIIDNNAIVGICEFCCSKYRDQLFPDVIKPACENIEAIFNAIRRFSIANKVFTTPYIYAEFKPEKGELANHRGFAQSDCEKIKKEVLNQIEVVEANMKDIKRIRGMAQTPRGWGENLSGISDPDLSLFLLALGIANDLNQRVYILTDEEKLRGFTSWSRTRPEVKEICKHPDKIEALHSMVYLDSVHRKCAITTDQITQMFGYRTYQQLTRKMIGGTTIGEMITITYGEIYQMINESSRIKQEKAMAIA